MVNKHRSQAWSMDIPGEAGDTPIMTALDRQSTDIFNWLLAAGADLRPVDKNLNTVLYRAVI